MTKRATIVVLLCISLFSLGILAGKAVSAFKNDLLITKYFKLLKH